MRRTVLFIILATFIFAGCVNTKELARKDQPDSLRAEIVHHNARREAAEKAEKLAKLEKENDRFERVLDYLHQLALESKWHLKLIGELQFENVTRFAETAQAYKNLADVCALLRKYHKVPKDHVCSLKKTKRLESNPKTENEMILEEFNKKVKQIEHRKKR